MIPSLPRSTVFKTGTWLYLSAFLIFLFLPLITVAVFAFNDAAYPAPPWHGFTWDWFLGNDAKNRVGLLADDELLNSILTSSIVASFVTLLSLSLGTLNAFLMERVNFKGKTLLATMILVPMVIPGVILGISILAFASNCAELLSQWFGWELEWLRPGLPLVVLGQFSYIAAISTLTIAARLKRFDRTLEEAALNLGASRIAVFMTILLPFLRPALLGAAAMSFLMSFENFNTTVMLVGSDAPLTIEMYGRMREGATPTINAVSVLLMLMSAVIALTLFRRDEPSNP